MHEQQKSSGTRYTATLTIAALGVVFGDIGTSPLYAFREAFTVADLDVTREGVLGVLSLIFWIMVIVVSVKYLAFVMRADHDGEGGILALTSLITVRGSAARRRITLVAVGVFGTALLYGDGMITPAISVLSAVEGLEIAVPGLEPFVLAITAAILVTLFVNQHRGTASLGRLFGPIMLVWFVVLSLLGVSQIIQEPAVFASLNPLHAIGFAFSEPRFSFLALGGVFLVVTGSEALYADMGHFGATPIRTAWFVLVFPALTLSYFGQGALLLRRPDAIEGLFYEMAPTYAVLPLVFLATLATVIASQALISGAYSLTSQAIQLGYLPRQRVDHTSPREFGQVYVSTINWLLMIASVGLVFWFGSSSRLAGAYGVGVAMIMVITTLLLFVVMRRQWNWHPVIVFGLTGVFLVIDLSLLGANITKVPGGGWFPLLIGVVGFVIMTTWKAGRRLMARRLSTADLPFERFVDSIRKHPQTRVPGTGVYLFAHSGLTPPTLLTNLRHHEVLHEDVVVVTVEVEEQPRIPGALRADVESFGEGFFRITLHYGFMEDPDVPLALANIVSSDFGFDPTDATYFIGRETVLPSSIPGLQPWREHLFAFLHRNATSAAHFFGLPTSQVVEVGIQIAI